MTTPRLIPPLLLLSLTLVACGGASETEGTPAGGNAMGGGMGGGEDSAPAAASYKDTPEAIAAGHRIMQDQACIRCHKEDGSPGIGPNLHDAEWLYGGEPETIYESIMHGRPRGMAPYEGRLSAQEVWNIVAYLRSEAAKAAKK